MESKAKPKGHWPKGKRRNADSGQWARIRLALIAFVENHWARGSISYSALAAELTVDKKTITRWHTGVDRPPEETQLAIAAWIAEKKKTIKK